MPFLVGLTGSIGMGKSTAAGIFAQSPDVAVWDADAAVHRLYGPGGAASAPIADMCPQAVGPDGVDRGALKDWIRADPDALKRIEHIVHPLVAADRARFLQDTDAPIAVLDIPLLFETGADAGMDLSVVVSTDPARQRERVLARPGMTPEQFDHILSVQMPDAVKRARADRIVRSDTMQVTRQDIADILNEIRGMIDA